MVSVQKIVEGLKAAFWVTMKSRLLLSPVAVVTNTGPLWAPEGTVVTMNVFVQSRGAAMGATTVPPAPLENSTVPDPWTSPNASPSHDSLSHVDASGAASMVDVGGKAETTRTARASATVRLGARAFEQVRQNRIAKGDVLTVAKIAGINAAKQTHALIPLCHQLLLRDVREDLSLDAARHAVRVETRATCDGKTGVEMEALVAASVAGLTVYDMCKAASKDIVVSDVRLESKTGGKSGDYRRAA